jgi:hypothetical protein
MAVENLSKSLIFKALMTPRWESSDVEAGVERRVNRESCDARCGRHQREVEERFEPKPGLIRRGIGSHAT